MNRIFFQYTFILVSYFLCGNAIGQNAWTETDGPFGGTLYNIKRAPNGTLYAVVNQKLYKSTNNADTWTAVVTTAPTSLFLNDILIESDGTLYAIYFSTIYTSSQSNEGVWEVLNTNKIQGGQYIMTAGPDNVFVVWGNSGLYVSTDKAVTWTQLSNAGWSGTPGCWSNAAGDLFYAIQGGKLLRHGYQGLTSNWSSSNIVELSNYETSSGGSNIATLTIDGTGRLYVSSFGDVFISDNNGDTYTSITANLNAASLTDFGGLLTTSPDNSVYFFATDNNLYKSTNQGTTWNSSPGPSIDYGANVRNITYGSASTMFVGTDGDGVFRTTDTASSWELKSNGLTGTSSSGIVISDTDRIILIKTGGVNSYWSSTDNGATWGINYLNGYINDGLKLSDGTIVLYGARVSRSTDDGASFTDDGNTYNVRKIIEASNGDLYGFRDGLISQSTDQGANWTDLVITGLPPTFQPGEAAIDGTTNIMCHGFDGIYKTFLIAGGVATQLEMPFTSGFNNVFFLDDKFYASQFSAFYYTSDLGANWTTVGFSGSEVLPLESGPYTGIAVSKTGSLNITQDDGGTWNSTNTPSTATITGIATNSAGDFFASGTSSPLLKYENELLVDPATLPPYIDFNWQPLNGPYGGQVLRVQAHPDGNTLFAVANGATLWRYQSGAWERIPQFAVITGIVFDIQIAANGDLYAVAVDLNQMYKSTDKGDTWTPLNSTGLPFPGITAIRGIEVLSDGSILAFGNFGGFGRIYKSTDGGVSFTEKHTSTYNILYPNNLTVHPIHNSSGKVVMVGATSLGNAVEGLLISTDFGDTWTVKSFPTIAGSSGVVNTMAFDDTGAIVMTAIQDNSIDNYVTEVVRSTNDGDTWTLVPRPDTDDQSNVGKSLIVLPSGEYILTIQTPVFDCYRSTDRGATWTFVGNFGDVYQSIEVEGSNIYLAGLVKGVQTTVDGTSFSFFNNQMPINSATDVEILNNKDLLVGATSPYYSDDFGQNFSLATSEVAGSFLVEGDEVIAYGSRRLQKSLDGGKTWSAIGDDRYFNYLAKDESTGGYYAFSNTEIGGTSVEFGLFFSTDLISWSKIELSGVPANYSITGLVNDSGGGIYILVLDEDTQITSVYKIVFGSAVNLKDVIGTSSPVSIKNFKDEILVYDATGIIFKSSDGDTWSQGSAPAGASLVVTNDYIFVTTNNSGLWLSRDEGVSWQSVGETFVSGVNFKDIAINEFDGYAYAAISASVVKKSGNIVIPDDGNGPEVATYLPANGATNVIIRPELVITFDEIANNISNKKIRVFDLLQPAVPVAVIDASVAVRSGKSFSIPIPVDLAYLKTHFVVIDPGAFEDIHGNAYAGISSNSTWRFTTQEEPDTQKPTITLVTTSLNLEKGAAKTFEVSVTDNKVLPTDKTKFFYRGITKLGSVAFASGAMLVSSGSGTTTSNFTITLQESWYDEMGLEFYFESEDGAGNIQRSPETPDTYYYSYINYPSSANPSIPSGRIAFGGTESSYRMISIPFDLVDAQVSTILNELGTYDKTKWRFYTYAGGNQFTENPSSFERGRGYWINVRNSPGALAIEGATTPSNNRTSFFRMTLQNGWNQIGNPYPVEISWDETRASDSNIGLLQIFNGTAYTDAANLLPFQGGFVKNNGPQVEVIVRFKGITTGGRRKSHELNSDLTQPNWAVPIIAVNNGIENRLGGVGMHESAKIGLDEFDNWNPPRFINYAELSFGSQVDDGTSLAKDMVPSMEEFVWEFNVVSSPGKTVLNWDNTVITGDKDLFFFDLENQNLVDMKKVGSYTLSSTSNKNFKIYFGNNIEEKIKPTEVTLGKPYPNPTTYSSFIRYTLPAGKSPYKAILEVYNSVGKRIAILKQGEFEPGFYDAAWNSESNPNGLYFYRLTVFEDGKSRSLIEKVIINR